MQLLASKLWSVRLASPHSCFCTTAAIPNQLLSHHSCSITTLQERRLSEAALQKAAERTAAALADFRLGQRAGQALGDVQHAVRSVRGAGELIVGAAATQAAERR